MKPEKGGEDMEDTDWVPADLLAEIGLLITEARTPDQSPKGRVEGPHCLPVQGTRGHVCDKHREQCRKSDLQKKQMYMLSKNNIPMRIDVLLMPNCDHGHLEASTVVGPIVTSQEDSTLLERWDVQILPKRLVNENSTAIFKIERCDVTFVTGRFLLQAIRSYLHFSQLSSWLTSQRGQLPVQVVYRLYAPGESVNHEFTSVPEKHSFPIADLSHSAVRAEVSSIPRQKTIPIFLCVEDTASGNVTRKRKSPLREGGACFGDIADLTENKHKSLPVKPKVLQKPCSGSSALHDPSSAATWRQKESRDCDNVFKFSLPGLPDDARHKSWEEWENPPWFYDSSDPTRNLQTAKKPPKIHQQKRPISTGSFFRDENEFKDSGLLEQSNKLKRRVDNSEHHLNTSQTCLRVNYEKKDTPVGTSKDQDLFKSISAMKETFKGNPLNLSNFQQEKSYKKSQNSTVLVKRLPSPKVLLTNTGNTKGTPVFFKRRKIDLGAPGDFYSDLDEDHVLSDAMNPLKSEDIEAYLSSLSHCVPLSEKTLDDIPLTQCNFYIGEKDKDINSQAHADEDRDLYWKAQTRDKEFAQQKSVQHGTNITPRTDKTESKQGAAVRNLFKKSLSEPGPSLHQLEAFEIPDINIKAEVSSAEVKVPLVSEDLSENGHSDDSTPTNSVTDCTDIMSSSLSSSPSSSIHPAQSSKPSSSSSGLSTSQQQEVHPSPREVTPVSKIDMCGHAVKDDSYVELMHDFSGLHIKCDSSLSTSKYSTSSKCDSTKMSKNSKVHCDLSNDLDKKSNPDCDVSKQDTDICDKNLNKNKKGKESALCKQLLNKELKRNLKNDDSLNGSLTLERHPHKEDILEFRKTLDRSSAMVFNTSTGLPSRSSPAPVKRKSTGRFDYDSTLTSARAIKNALSCSKLVLQSECTGVRTEDSSKVLSTSAPASTNCLLGNFEESILNGRIEPAGVVNGFTAEIGAGGCFCPKHVTIPVTSYFFQLSDDNAPSPYLGHINLDSIGKRGYHIPKCGTLQVTLFNPNKTVVKMFVVMYDLSDMPPNCQTFLRQRTLYTPVDPNSCEPSYLRYLIHLRISSSKTGKIFLHTDIRLIFARDKFEFDPKVANYELRSYTEGPHNPKFSPKR